jgi:hypothetical protein
MTGEQISGFVDRLEFGKVSPGEFKNLTARDWYEVRRLLEARRRFQMQKYVNAVCALRLSSTDVKRSTDAQKIDVRQKEKRVYTEAEILSELGT